MFVSDELMGKLLKSTNITTEDVEEDEINERSIRIVKRAEALKKAGKWEDADRSGVEYYFLKSFMTNDLYKDFPVIINHFLKHCSDKVQKYMAAWWYGSDEFDIYTMDEAVKHKVFRAIYNGAKLGDDYCRKLIIYLYKTYFKKEYNQLKRYSKLSMYDVYDLCENGSGYQKGSRILLMADFLNIKHDETCSCLSAVIQESMERETRNYEKITDPEPLNEDLYHASAIQVNVWSDQELQRRRKYPFREYCKIMEFAIRTLREFGLDEDYIFAHLDDDNNFDAITQKLTQALYTLWEFFPGKEFSFEEIQHAAAIRTIMEGMYGATDDLKCEIDVLLGDDGYWDNPQQKFSPDFYTEPKKKGNKQPAEEAKAVENPKAAEEEAVKKIAKCTVGNEEIKRKINEQERMIHDLQKQCREQGKESQKMEQQLLAWENERTELVALRNFVYQMKIEDNDPEVSEDSIESMKKAIADKDIIIIGGHINWHNKLRRIFPKWTFLLTEEFKTVDGKMLENKDKVYFFTDHMNHTAYEKFIVACRERNIEFGYLATINKNQLIQRVYEDLCD